MKKLFILAFLSMPVLAQVPNPAIINVGTAPSGACNQTLPLYVAGQSAPWFCNSGTWTQLGSASGGDSITSPNSTITVGGTATATTIDLNLAHSFTFSAAVTASTPPIFLTGALCGASCNGTTSFPVYFHQPTGTSAATTWSNGANNGTAFGANEASGFTGNYWDFFLNGVHEASLGRTGIFSTAAGMSNLAAIGNATVNVSSTGPSATTSVAGNVGLTVNNSNATPTADLQDWQAHSIKVAFIDSVGGIDPAAYNQSAASQAGGTCAMVAGTSCTITIGHTYTTPVCIATQQSATLTGAAVGCTVSGTTVTITSAVSNSETWGAFVFGNPN